MYGRKRIRNSPTYFQFLFLAQKNLMNREAGQRTAVGIYPQLATSSDSRVVSRTINADDSLSLFVMCVCTAAMIAMVYIHTVDNNGCGVRLCRSDDEQ